MTYPINMYESPLISMSHNGFNDHGNGQHVTCRTDLHVSPLISMTLCEFNVHRSWTACDIQDKLYESPLISILPFAWPALIDWLLTFGYLLNVWNPGAVLDIINSHYRIKTEKDICMFYWNDYWYGYWNDIDTMILFKLSIWVVYICLCIWLVNCGFSLLSCDSYKSQNFSRFVGIV